MRYKYLFLIILLIRAVLVSGQDIVYAEYFVNTDPGFENANSIAITPAPDIAGISFDLDLTSLSDGFHHIYVRVKDANGKWSLTNANSFYKETLHASLPNITEAEFFINTDPGLGNGEAISVSPGQDITDLTITKDISSLDNGFHHLYVRVKDANGKWSLTNANSFYKETLHASLPNITEAEFFINTDPGLGNGEAISVSPGQDVTNLTIAKDISSLDNGFHHLYIRVKDANGKWSLTNVKPFYKETLYTIPQNIVEVEYFFNNDPGFGNGAKVPITPNAHQEGLNFFANASGLPQGTHIFFVRVKDENGKWSLIHTDSFDFEGEDYNLISPVAQQIITSGIVEFQWEAFPGAISYELYVDNNADFSSPEISKVHIKELHDYTNTDYSISANWLHEGQYYWKVVAVTPFNQISSLTESFHYQPEKHQEPQWVPFYRAYYPNDADHFYCSSETHLQTALDGNYRFEGVEGYVALHPFEAGNTNSLQPIYRLYIPDPVNEKGKAHYYTSSTSDKDNRIAQGWIYEGITGYGLSNNQPGLTKLYHTYLHTTSPVVRDNFYTISEIEKNNAINLFGFSDQGYICYISATGDQLTTTWMGETMMAGFGINPFNGNFGSSNNDIFSIPEGNISLNYSHFYNSNAVRLLQTSEPLGVGWNHNYNATLKKTDDIIFVLWGSEVHLFDAQSMVCETPGVYDILTGVNANKYQIRKKDQTLYTFENLNTDNIINTLRLTSVADRHGNTLTLAYNSRGWLKHIKSPENRFISFTYYPSADKEKAGLVKYVKDSLALNRVVEYVYDNQRNLVEFRDASGQSTTYAYNTDNPFDHYLETITYPDGTKITNTFDPETKRLISQNLVSENTDKVTSVSIPSANQVTITDETGMVTNLTYNTVGSITELLTPAGNSTFEYGDQNNPTQPTKIQDGMGYITNVTYNSMGDPLQINKPEGITHQYAWNNTNDLTSYTNPLGKTTVFTYSAGKLTSVQEPFGTGSSVVTNLTYFDNGNIHTLTNPLNQTTTFSYDAYRNVSIVADNMGNTTSYAYDNASRVVSVQDANNNVTTFAYDLNDRQISASDPLNNTTTYNYDGLQRLISVKDARNHTTSLNYNPNNGLLNSLTDQLGNNTSFTYYDNGLLHTKTDRKNQTLTYGYDQKNRLSSVTGAAINRAFVYDLNDHITQLSDLSGNINFVYDPLSRLSSYTDFYGNQVQYEYDKAGNITKMVYPENKQVVYTYYDDGSLHTVTDWLSHTTTYLYNNDGSLSRVNNPNGTYTEYSYDAAGRLTDIKNRKSDHSIISGYSYQLDPMGNHLSVEQEEPIEFSGVAPGEILYNYNNANRLISGGTVNYTFDNNGNLTNRNDNGNVTSYTYNAEDLLTSISGSINASYLYDGFGKRRQAIRDGNEKRYILDISSDLEFVIAETNSSNSVDYYYVYGHGLLYRVKASDNAVSYYHYDYRGSTTAMTDQSQNITHSYSYDEFGKVVADDEADFNPFRYVGRYGVMYENENLYFMRARFYDPSTGRFLSEDPVWDVNLYAYAGNNPLVFVDIDGNSAIRLMLDINKSIKTAGVIHSYLNNKATLYDVAESSLDLFTGASYYDIMDAKRKSLDYIHGRGSYTDMLKAQIKLLKAVPILGDAYTVVTETANLFSEGYKSAKFLYKYYKKRK